MQNEGLITGRDARLIKTGLVSLWWVFALRGAAAALFGALAFGWPSLALSTLVLVFAAYAFIDGGAGILLFALAVGRPRNRWWQAALAIAGIASGVAAVVWPQPTGVVLIDLVAVWAVVSGSLQVLAAPALGHEVNDKRLLVLSGAMSIASGLALFLLIPAGLMVLTTVLAIYSTLHGVMLIGFALKLRTLALRS